MGINGSVKNLEHPWNLSNAEKVLYSRETFLQFFFIIFKMFVLRTVH